MSENKNNDVIYRRLIKPSISIPATLLTLGYVSSKFWRKSYLIHNLNVFRKYLQSSINLNSTKSISGHNKKLAYVYGEIKQSSIKPVEDPIFGVQSSQNSRGLYRKYEIYSQLEHKKYDWININQLQDDKIPGEYSNFKSNVQTSSDMMVENHILAQPLIQQLAEQSSNTIRLTPSEVDKHFEQIRNSFLEFNKNQLSEVITNPSSKAYDQHPFKHAISQHKEIFYEDNYIYICNNSNKMSEFDLRVSLHDIQKIVDVTILAQKRDNTLDQFEIPEILNQNIIVEITNSQGQKVQKQLGLVNFIQKGLMEHNDVIQKLFTEGSKQTAVWILLYAFAVYVLYQFMCEQMGPVLDINNWSEASIDQLAKQYVSKQGDKFIVEDPQFSTTKYAFLSSTTHIACNYLFAAGSSLSFIIGGPLVVYWFYAFARKTELEMKMKGEIQNLQTYSEHFQNSTFQQDNNIFQNINFEKN